MSVISAKLKFVEVPADEAVAIQEMYELLLKSLDAHGIKVKVSRYNLMMSHEVQALPNSKSDRISIENEAQIYVEVELPNSVEMLFLVGLSPIIRHLNVQHYGMLLDKIEIEDYREIPF